MMYSNKQKLAMAMAAAMVASVVPAMSFAAEKDVLAVIAELNKEKVPETNALNLASAKDVLAKAKAVENGQADAMALTAAYEASIKVMESADLAAWTANKADYDTKVTALKAAVPAISFADSFESKNTKDNHQKKFDELSGFTSIEGELKNSLAGWIVSFTLPSAGPITDVKVGDVLVDPALNVKQKGATGWEVRLGIGDENKTKPVTFKFDGKTYKVHVK